jgi:hypothetical protein
MAKGPPFFIIIEISFILATIGVFGIDPGVAFINWL